MTWRERERYGLLIAGAMATLLALLTWLTGGSGNALSCPVRQDAIRTELVEGDSAVCVYTLQDRSVVTAPPANG